MQLLAFFLFIYMNFYIIKVAKRKKWKNILYFIRAKNYSPFALLGYKTFSVNKNELDIIYDYINNKIK
jgi:hypothetical protein